MNCNHKNEFSLEGFTGKILGQLLKRWHFFQRSVGMDVLGDEVLTQLKLLAAVPNCQLFC